MNLRRIFKENLRNRKKTYNFSLDLIKISQKKQTFLETEIYKSL